MAQGAGKLKAAKTSGGRKNTGLTKKGKRNCAPKKAMASKEYMTKKKGWVHGDAVERRKATQVFDQHMVTNPLTSARFDEVYTIELHWNSKTMCDPSADRLKPILALSSQDILPELLQLHNPPEYPADPRRSRPRSTPTLSGRW
ncbi:hypothetical protein A1Q2_07438 [Trichosporon asahii var. asahii CBS 8904]|uniref:Uncharacterized protein n=1 Tax=Trichosporon asahii var. asahii (strain CBS 8904) TaxID=1220162 RepID=K1V3A4_TRIAC|nr:hypothetical protein A1Q2_07438 [Trichosporon asahii var. asahii CBS 8904]